MGKGTIFSTLIIFIGLGLSAQMTDIDTLIKSGIKDNRINFAFANVGHATATAYTDKMDFLSDLENVVDRFDPTSPLRKNGYSHYRNFFNVYSVWFTDPFIFEAIPSYYQESQAAIDNLFLPWADDEHGWITMMYSLKGGGGGGAGRRDDLRRGDALIWGLDWETILHEFNHTMPGVGDEYTASGEWSNFNCGESPNQTPALSRDEVPWRNWIAEDTPIPTPYTEEYFDVIGAFEGTISGYFGCQRPTAKSCYMGAGGFGDGFGTDMCSVCLQRFICRTYHFVDAIEEEIPAQQAVDVAVDQTMTFSVKTIKPIPNTQQYKWFLNGKCVATGVESVDITFGECEFYELQFVMTDTTSFVRHDEEYDYLYPKPQQTHTWSISNSGATPSNLDAELSVTNANCSGDANGSITVVATGGETPYYYIINGQEYPSNIQNLAAGLYEINIVDANGCNVIKEIEVLQDPVIDCSVISEFQNGVWKLYPVFSSEVDASNFSFLWSNGKTEREVFVTEKQIYSIEILTDTNCSIYKEIELAETPCAELDVEHEIVQPSDNFEGALYLDIINGSSPYSIKWFRNVTTDLTWNDADASFSSGNDVIAIHLTEFLFDDIVEYNIDFWAEGFTGDNYAGFDFGQPTTIDFYSLTSNVDVQGRDARNWTLQGSNDMNNWDVIDTKSDIVFEERLQRKEFLLAQEVTYRFYRVYITENSGDGWIAIQEMEFGSSKTKEEIKESRDDAFLIGLNAGPYSYEVIDANRNREYAEVLLIHSNQSASNAIVVVQDGFDRVKIQDPEANLDYYWFADAEASLFLHSGNSFQPQAPGNYFVRSLEKSTMSFTSAPKGFAVTMLASPEILSNNESFTIVNPILEAEYHWYNGVVGGAPIHVGTSFTAVEMGDYYVSMRLPITDVPEIDPSSLNNITLWADASDIDGDNQTDIGLENSSAYKWKFKINGGWDQNGWHAYRSNYSNGLGVVELGTVWFQYVNNQPTTMRTIVIVYEENGFSRKGTAPFYGLKNYMGRHEDQSQIFADNISNTALNGKVHINGEEIDPLNTFNSYAMKSLSVVLTQDEDLNLYAIDEYWEGKIAELITFDRELTEEELTGVHAYLRKKWLSTADLDSPRTKVSWKEDMSYNITEEVLICAGQDYLGLTEEGTYVREMKTSEGYDSIVTTILEVSIIDPEMVPVITANGNILTTDSDAVNYQWYLNGVLIMGATNKDYQASEDGNYTLTITDINGCMITSEAFFFTISSLSEAQKIRVNIFPNPTSDFITIENDDGNSYEFSIVNGNGQIIKSGSMHSKILVIDLSGFTSGTYSLVIKNADFSRVLKLIKL